MISNECPDNLALPEATALAGLLPAAGPCAAAAAIAACVLRYWGWIRKAGRPSSAGQLVLLGELRALKGFALGTNAEKLKRPRERQKERGGWPKRRSGFIVWRRL